MLSQAVSGQEPTPLVVFDGTEEAFRTSRPGRSGGGSRLPPVLLSFDPVFVKQL